MTPEAKVLMEDMQRKCQELIPLMEKVQQQVIANCSSAFELADIAFSAREVENTLEEFQKRLRLLYRAAATACCLNLAATGEDVVRTSYCTASPNPRPWYKVPYKRDLNPQLWDTIMEDINVQDPAKTQDLVRIHAPGLMDYCTELRSNGRPIVKGIDPTTMSSMELNLRITKKK